MKRSPTRRVTGTNENMIFLLHAVIRCNNNNNSNKTSKVNNQITFSAKLIN